MNIGIPPSPSCRTLDEIPLPSSRKLWEAATKSEWESIYKDSLSSKESSSTLNIGDLRAAQDSDSITVDMSLVDEYVLAE
jgi:hypothetical protein